MSESPRMSKMDMIIACLVLLAFLTCLQVWIKKHFGFDSSFACGMIMGWAMTKAGLYP